MTYTLSSPSIRGPPASPRRNGAGSSRSRRSSTSSLASPAQWHSPASLSPFLPSPTPDFKGKGRASPEPSSATLSLTRTRSHEGAKKGSVDLEGGAKGVLRGLGLDMGLDRADATLKPNAAPLARRNRAPPQIITTGWSTPQALSRLTRRRGAPDSPLPLAMPSPTYSTPLSASSSSSPLSFSPAMPSVGMRLRRASRAQRSERKRGSIEVTTLYACGCACLFVLLVLVTAAVPRHAADSRQFFEGAGLVPGLGVAPTASHFAAAHGVRPSHTWRKRKPMAPLRDTLVLYRILGNDLPPRHTHGQTLRNVAFMLEHEHDFDDLPGSIARVEKYYVLNRIVSTETVAALRTLFRDYGVSSDRVLYIPFEWEEYAKTRLQWQGGVADYPGIWDLERPDYDPPLPFETLATNATGETDLVRQQQAETMGRLRAIDFTYHHKNQYAINNNGGRNFALAHGRTLDHARWILPLDGNCFFTPSAMDSLISTLASSADGAESPQHVVIPMKRLLANDAVLSSNHLVEHDAPAALPPVAPEEPQIGFRFDAVDSYQSSMRYGRRSKLELLWRLGAVSRSRDLHRRILPWEGPDRQILTADSYGSIRSERAETNYVMAGWVFRLFSGDSRQELHSTEANVLRNMNRVKGIVGFLERLDEVLVRGMRCTHGHAACGFSSELLWAFDFPALEQLGYEYRRGNVGDGVVQLLEAAQAAARLAEDPAAIEAMEASAASNAAAALTLASFVTGDDSLALTAARLVRSRFLDSDAAPRPAVPIASIMGDGRGYTFPLTATTVEQPLWTHASRPSARWPADFDATQLVDIFRLLSPAYLRQSLHREVHDLLAPHRVHAVLSAHLARLLLTAGAKRTLDDGAAYDVQVAALAGAVDDVRLLGRIASRAALRLRSGETAPLAHSWLAHSLQRVQYSDEADMMVDGRRIRGDQHGQTLVQSWGEAFAALKL